MVGEQKIGNMTKVQRAATMARIGDSAHVLWPLEPEERYNMGFDPAPPAPPTGSAARTVDLAVELVKKSVEVETLEALPDLREVGLDHDPENTRLHQFWNLQNLLNKASAEAPSFE